MSSQREALRARLIAKGIIGQAKPEVDLSMLLGSIAASVQTRIETGVADLISGTIDAVDGVTIGYLAGRNIK